MAADSTPAEKRADFVAVEPIMADGKRHEPGDTVSLLPADAADLLKQGAVKRGKRPAAQAEG